VVTAKHAFSGNAHESQISFPPGATIKVSPDAHHAPRDGWMHGTYQGQSGWFPESYIEYTSTSNADGDGPPSDLPPLPPPPPPQATAYPVYDSPHQASAPPSAMAVPISASEPNITVQPRHVVSDQQIAELIPQGYTRGMSGFIKDSRIEKNHLKLESSRMLILFSLSFFL